jgi:hypothetical protein
MSTESMFQLDVIQKIKLVTNFNTTKSIQAGLNNATKFGYHWVSNIQFSYNAIDQSKHPTRFNQKCLTQSEENLQNDQRKNKDNKESVYMHSIQILQKLFVMPMIII